MYTQEQIESAYQKLSTYKPKDKNKNSWMQNVVQYMLDYPEKIWFFSWEFNNVVNSKQEWLSYKWCARASDVAIHHPTIVESRKVWRFCVYRLCTENMNLIEDFLWK